jgi:ABC-type spermidine/putrescine transport system permease subunit I
VTEGAAPTPARELKSGRLRAVPLPVAVGGMAPNLLIALALFVVPAAFVLVYSLGTLDYISLGVGWGWSGAAYRTALGSPYIETLFRSLLLAAATVVACAPFAFAIAFVINQATPRMRVALFLLVLFPFWTSFIVRTYAWTNILGPAGVVADATAALGHRVVFIGTWSGILIGMVASYLPIMTLPVYVALSRVPAEIVQAARDLGATEARIVRTILIPAAAPGFAVGAFLVGIPATGEYVVPAVLGAGKTALIGNLLADELTQNGDYPLGAAVTMTLIVALVVILVAIRLGSLAWRRFA